MDTFDPKHIYSDAAKLARLKDKKLFLFDIDGTIAVGDTLYEGSADLLRYIQAIGGRAYYITNNSTKSGLDYVKKFHDAFHLDSTEDQFITSGYMTLRFLKENYTDKKIFVLGTASFVAELRKNGLWVTEVCEDGIDCVVVAYDSELNYAKLTEVCKVLFTQDVPFYGTNPDLRCPIDFGFIPDCGAICDMITATTGWRSSVHRYCLRHQRWCGHLCSLHRRGTKKGYSDSRGGAEYPISAGLCF